MKRIFTLLLVFASITVFAQRPTATIEQVNAFMKSKTYVIKRDDLLGDYNAFMEKALKDNWKLTQYELITYEEFEKLRLDKNNSFILMTEMNFFKDKVVTSYDFISVLIGGDYKKVKDMPEICSFPLAFTNDDEKENTMNKVPAIIAFMSSHIKNIQSNSKLLKDKKYKYYTKQKKSIANKTFYLIKDEQSSTVKDEKAIKALYPGTVKFVEIDDITKTVEGKKSDIVFLHRVTSPEGIPGTRCYTIIMSGSGELLYFNYHLITGSANNGILAKEWKKFKKYIK